MKRKRILITALLVLVLLPVLLIFVANSIVQSASRNKLYSDVTRIPFRKTGILLGTSRNLPGGNINPYYQHRINAALELLRHNKIRYLVVSGDNSRAEYNEPEDMRQDLIRAGIDSSRIYRDYAGFRTFDSMVRLKEIFGQDSVTVISQRFHNERALYIAKNEGIAAIGYNADDVQNRATYKQQVREKLARVKVLIDYLVGQEPKFGGEKIVLPD